MEAGQYMRNMHRMTAVIVITAKNSWKIIEIRRSLLEKVLWELLRSTVI